MKRIAYLAIRDNTVYEDNLIQMIKYWREKFSMGADVIDMVIIESLTPNNVEYTSDSTSSLQSAKSLEQMAQQLFEKGIRIMLTPTSQLLLPILPWLDRKFNETKNDQVRMRVVNLIATAPRILESPGVISLVPNATSLLRVRPFFRRYACAGNNYVIIDNNEVNQQLLERLHCIMKISKIYTHENISQIKSVLRPEDTLWILTFDPSFLNENYPEANYVAFDTIMDTEIDVGFKHKIVNVDFKATSIDINVKNSVITNGYDNTVYYFAIKLTNMPDPNDSQAQIDMQINRILTSMSSYGTDVGIPIYTMYYYQKGIWYRPGEWELFEDLFEEIKEKAMMNNVHPMYVWFVYTRYFMNTFTIETSSNIDNIQHEYKYSESDLLNYIDNIYALNNVGYKENLKQTLIDIGDFTNYVKSDSYINDNAIMSTALY